MTRAERIAFCRGVVRGGIWGNVVGLILLALLWLSSGCATVAGYVFFGARDLGAKIEQSSCDRQCDGHGKIVCDSSGVFGCRDSHCECGRQGQ